MAVSSETTHAGNSVGCLKLCVWGQCWRRLEQARGRSACRVGSQSRGQELPTKWA